MPGRRPKPLFGLPEKWDKNTARSVYEYFKFLFDGMKGLQGSPAIAQNASATSQALAGTSQTPSPDDHSHDVITGAPAVNVQLSGASSEGSGSALMRASATLVLDDGGAADGEVLVYGPTPEPGWHATPISSITDDTNILTWMNL